MITCQRMSWQRPKSSACFPAIRLQVRQHNVFPAFGAEFLYSTVQAIYAAMSKCASSHPSTDAGEGQAQALADDDEGEADWAELLRQADANGNDAAGQGMSEAGRVRVDYSTPNARFGPY